MGDEPPVTDTPTPSPGAAPAQVTPTPSPTDAPSVGGDDPLEGTLITPPPRPSPELAPLTWKTFTNSGVLGFTFRYPENWYVDGVARVMSWDPERSASVRYPPGGMVFDVNLADAESAVARPPEAVDIMVDGSPGWESLRIYDSPPEGAIARIHSVTIDVGQQRLFLIGFFSDPAPDEGTFWKIVDSFRFTEPSWSPDGAK
jgi:hypothetical protein